MTKLNKIQLIIFNWLRCTRYTSCKTSEEPCCLPMQSYISLICIPILANLYNDLLLFAAFKRAELLSSSTAFTLAPLSISIRTVFSNPLPEASINFNVRVSLIKVSFSFLWNVIYVLKVSLRFAPQYLHRLLFEWVLLQLHRFLKNRHNTFYFRKKKTFFI